MPSQAPAAAAPAEAGGAGYRWSPALQPGLRAASWELHASQSWDEAGAPGVEGKRVREVATGAGYVKTAEGTRAVEG